MISSALDTTTTTTVTVEECEYDAHGNLIRRKVTKTTTETDPKNKTPWPWTPHPPLWLDGPVSTFPPISTI